MSSLTDQLNDLHTELRENVRLRLGVWLILSIAIIYVLLVQSDRIALAHTDYTEQVKQLQKVAGIRGDDDWSEQLNAQQAIARKLDEAFWEAETKGLAEASLQGALSDMMNGLEIRGGRINPGVTQPAPDMPGVWQIQAQLDGSYRPGAELQLLYAIATHPRKLVIDRLDLSRQNSRILVLVSAYFVGISSEQ